MKHYYLDNTRFTSCKAELSQNTGLPHTRLVFLILDTGLPHTRLYKPGTEGWQGFLIMHTE